MAQTATIDPAPFQTSPSRSANPKQKQVSTFAATLDENRVPKKTQAEPRDIVERPKRKPNFETAKYGSEQPDLRKTDHRRDEAQQSKAEPQIAKRGNEDGASQPASAEEKEPDTTSHDDLPISSEIEQISHDQDGATENTNPADSKHSELVAPLQAATPVSQDIMPPSAPPVQTSLLHPTDAQPGDDPSETQSDVALVSFRHTPSRLQSNTPSMPMQPAHDAEDISYPDQAKIKPELNAPIQAENQMATNSEDNPKFSDHMESLSPQQETKPQAQSSGTQVQLPTAGALHTLQHHLGLDASSSQPPAPSHFAEQIKATLVPYHALPIEIGLRALDGVKEISLDLTPKELGQVSIRISVDEQSSIQVSIAAEQPKTLTLLQHDAHHIRHALEQAGYSTHDTSLQFSLQNNMSSNSNSSRDDQRKPASRRGSNSEIAGVEPEISAPAHHRIHLNQLDLSV